MNTMMKNSNTHLLREIAELIARAITADRIRDLPRPQTAEDTTERMNKWWLWFYDNDPRFNALVRATSAHIFDAVKR